MLAVEEHGIEQLTERRIKTCEDCSAFDAKERKCTACGCFMDIKSKLTTNRTPTGGIELTHCPNGLWGDIHITNMYRKLKGEQPLKVFTNNKKKQ